MSAELPYLPSYKNVGLLFQKISTAKVPQSFTQKFLSDTIGLKGSGDRALLALLRTLGFIDAAGKPTGDYSSLKNPSLAKKVIASAIKRAYAPLFEANESANQLTNQELKGLIAQVAGADDGITTKIAGTFNSLVKQADFDGMIDASQPIEETEEESQIQDPPQKMKPTAKLHPEFHYNIQIHLPSNASEETYLNIFNALRKTFQ